MRDSVGAFMLRAGDLSEAAGAFAAGALAFLVVVLVDLAMLSPLCGLMVPDVQDCFSMCAEPQ